MNLVCRIATATWQEPESGQASEVWALTASEWRVVERAIAWVRREMKDEVGDTIVNYSFHPTHTGCADKLGLQMCLEEIALQVRYSSGEELYAVDCPIFTKYGIQRN